MKSLSLILVIGSAGSGKTTFARHLVAKLRCVYLNTDPISDVLFPGDRDSAAYLKARPAIYRALYDLAFANLQAGNSVLLDAPHATQIRDPEWRAWITGEADKTGARLRVIRCFADTETVRRRLQARGHERDTAKLDNWSEFTQSEPFRGPLPLPHIEIDTGDDIDRNLALAMDYLSSP